MAFKGPGDRTITLDNASTTPTDITAWVREIDGMEELDAENEDMTGPGDTKPVNRNSGFITAADVTIKFEQDTGGTYDARNDLLLNVGSTTTRTLLVTYSSGKTWSVETNIIKGKSHTPNKLETFVTITLRPTGSWTAA